MSFYKNKALKITAKEVMDDRSRFIVFIGVDWNHDQVGSRILVIAYDKIIPQFYKLNYTLHVIFFVLFYL